MKIRKYLIFILLPFLFIFTSCSLFNDKDIKINNKYSTPTKTMEDGTYLFGVLGKEVEGVNNTLCFKNLSYAPDGYVTNTYKTTGINYNGYTVNNNSDYESNTSSNNYDLYVPNSVNKNDTHKVILFIHGGAWVSGFKTDVNKYIFDFANEGYISATIKYTLLKRIGEDTSRSIFRNLDEIDQCIKSIKLALNELGFDTTKTELVIGGASSGAHLAMLYSYSRGNNSALPIKFIIDAVGPVDLKPDNWKEFENVTDSILDAGLGKDAIQIQKDNNNLGELEVSGEEYNWNEYQTMRIACGFCGYPYSLDEVKASTNSNEEQILYPNEASNSMTNPGGGEDLLSVTYWISSTNKYPIICAYAGKDSIVGINQFATLEAKLDACNIEYEYFYFRNSDHIEIGKEYDNTTYTSFVNKIVEWLESK